MYNLKPKIMTKTLRFSLLSMLIMLCGSIYADEVKFDFSGDNAYSLFGLPGFSSGTGDSYVSDGDITEDKSVKSGDVTITVSPSTSNTPNRMWKGSLRMYGGTLTVASSGKNITAIEFALNSNKWGNNTANVGTLETGKWTGNAASVVITVGGNTQIKSMTVTLGEGGTTPDPDPEPQPGEIKKVTVAEFNAAAESTDVWYQLSGTVKNLKDGDIYGNFDLEDATGSVYVYGLLAEKGGAKGEFQALAAEKGIKNGCKITIIGNRGSYKDKIEVTNAYFVSIDEAAPAEITISGETTFVESTVVTITPSDVDHDVYYTLDGTDPKTSSTQVRYMEPFTITETCTVRAWEEDADIYAEKTFTKAEAPAEMTVEDVIAAAPENTNATEGQQKVWVKGYIVGFVDGAKLADGAKFTAEGCETATNLLLATNPAETNVENCIPVQLPSGDIRAALNLQDNPDNLGKEVKLYGYVLKYFSVPGLKNVTAYEFTGETGVEMISAEAQQNGRIYNLAGQRVDNAFKGIVIVGGKKIVKK